METFVSTETLAADENQPSAMRVLALVGGTDTRCGVPTLELFFLWDTGLTGSANWSEAKTCRGFGLEFPTVTLVNVLNELLVAG